MGAEPPTHTAIIRQDNSPVQSLRERQSQTDAEIESEGEGEMKDLIISILAAKTIVLLALLAQGGIIPWYVLVLSAAATFLFLARGIVSEPSP